MTASSLAEGGIDGPVADGSAVSTYTTPAARSFANHLSHFPTEAEAFSGQVDG